MPPRPTIPVPPSKSITHRALFCAASAEGKSVIENPLVCEDTLATAGVLTQLGAIIQKENGRWLVHGGPFQNPKNSLDCKESGTTWRFITALTDVLKIPCTITGSPSLLRRPQRPDPSVSSQYLSGLLLAKQFCIPVPVVSQSYVDLTRSVQKIFGVEKETDAYRPASIRIEGDWSAAAVLLAAGVLTKGVVLEGLNRESLQGDRAIFNILKEMGAEIFWDGERLVARPSVLRAANRDLSQTPDLYPIVAVLNALAEGEGRLTGLERLRFKESDRLAAVNNLLKFSTGCQAPYVISTDHRIIMAAAVLGKAGGVEMKFKHPECVAKSWPGFWEVFNNL